MTSPTRYRTVHESGKTGPLFQFASQAALWIIAQPDMTLWRWEAVR